MRILFFLLFMGVSALNAKENPSVLYISQFKEIAIAEMQRTGIPASIKMAQALLESGAGKSTLALQANNHFGIKCGGSWDGKTFYRKDDDYNSKGKLIESCFRKFSSADESFMAHSRFLTDNKRYAFLFDLPANDYHAWAYGLKKAGYATDQAYPQKLINIIEKYQLFLYDSELHKVDESGSTPIVNVEDSNNKRENTKEKRETRSSKSDRSNRKSRSKKDRKNSRSSNRSKSSSRSKKTKSSSSKDVFHVMKEGQSISDISKRYGLNENLLRLRNRLPKNAEPLVGETIYLRKKVRILNRPQYSKSNNKRASNNKFIF